jgi:hypothetical protein
MDPRAALVGDQVRDMPGAQPRLCHRRSSE